MVTNSEMWLASMGRVDTHENPNQSPRNVEQLINTFLIQLHVEIVIVWRSWAKQYILLKLTSLVSLYLSTCGYYDI